MPSPPSSSVSGWLERDGLSPDVARERAQLAYGALEGALAFAKALRSIEPLTTLRRQLPELLQAKVAARPR
jgi:hypothetical protein